MSEGILGHAERVIIEELGFSQAHELYRGARDAVIESATMCLTDGDEAPGIAKGGRSRQIMAVRFPHVASHFRELMLLAAYSVWEHEKK